MCRWNAILRVYSTLSPARIDIDADATLFTQMHGVEPHACIPFAGRTVCIRVVAGEELHRCLGSGYSWALLWALSGSVERVERIIFSHPAAIDGSIVVTARVQRRGIIRRSRVMGGIAAYRG